MVYANSMIAFGLVGWPSLNPSLSCYVNKKQPAETLVTHGKEHICGLIGVISSIQ